MGWIWARSPLTIPLPGFRDMEQLQLLVDAQQFGPLSQDVMDAIADRVKSG
jgi:aryl-alcohol dehydrogenase-like predicted oxidoreductase